MILRGLRDRNPRSLSTSPPRTEKSHRARGWSAEYRLWDPRGWIHGPGSSQLLADGLPREGARRETKWWRAAQPRPATAPYSAVAGQRGSRPGLVTCALLPLNFVLKIFDLE